MQRTMPGCGDKGEASHAGDAATWPRTDGPASPSGSRPGVCAARGLINHASVCPTPAGGTRPTSCCGRVGLSGCPAGWGVQMCTGMGRSQRRLQTHARRVAPTGREAPPLWSLGRVTGTSWGPQTGPGHQQNQAKWVSGLRSSDTLTPRTGCDVGLRSDAFRQKYFVKFIHFPAFSVI